MNKPSIFAKSITNLTDARYFAAMGVDFLGFDISGNDKDTVDIGFLTQVREWVEGPSIIGCVQGDESLNKLTKMVVDGNLDGIYFNTIPPESCLKSFDSIERFIELAPGQIEGPPINDLKLVLNTKDVLSIMDHQPDRIIQFANQGNLFLNGDFDDSFFNSALFKYKPGMILLGSEEEKTGFKSFEDLDRIFERLEMI